MRWAGLLLALLMFLAGIRPMQAGAEMSGPLLITEVMPGTADNAKQEFIELYNRSDQPLEFRDGSWRLEVASAAATNWQKPLRTLVLDGYLYPDNYYLIGSAYSQTVGGEVQAYRYPESADGYFSSALSAPGGHVRIVHTTEGGVDVASDIVEWGGPSTVSLDGQTIFPAGTGIATGSSLGRVKTNGQYIVSGNSSQDFELTSNPSPQTTTADQPFLEPPAESTPINTIRPLPPLSLVITEILPNPAAPYTDDDDEYIEIYNPNSESVSLAGYSLQVGTTKTRKYTFPDNTIIESQAYAVYYSAATTLSLSNSGSQVKLLDPNGNIASLTDVYETAKDGLVWQMYDGKWQWSAKQTPGTANQYLAVATTSKSVKSSSSAKQSTTAKTAGNSVNESEEATSPAYIHNAVLAAIVGLALLYGAYEYRHDLANRFRQLRSYRSTRRQPRPAVARQ